MKKMNLWSKGARKLEHTEGRWLLYFAPTRIAALCLLVFAMFPSLSRAQDTHGSSGFQDFEGRQLG